MKPMLSQAQTGIMLRLTSAPHGTCPPRHSPSFSSLPPSLPYLPPHTQSGPEYPTLKSLCKPSSLTAVILSKFTSAAPLGKSRYFDSSISVSMATVPSSANNSAVVAGSSSFHASRPIICTLPLSFPLSSPPSPACPGPHKHGRVADPPDHTRGQGPSSLPESTGLRAGTKARDRVRA